MLNCTRCEFVSWAWDAECSFLESGTVGQEGGVANGFRRRSASLSRGVTATEINTVDGIKCVGCIANRFSKRAYVVLVNRLRNNSAIRK